MNYFDEMRALEANIHLDEARREIKLQDAIDDQVRRFFDNAVCCEQCGSFYDESYCPRCEEFE